jgi:hypothetical protein
MEIVLYKNKKSVCFYTYFEIFYGFHVNKYGLHINAKYSDWLLAGRSGDRIPVGARFSAPVQTDPGAHPASCTMGTGSFPGVKNGRGVTLTVHPFLLPWSLISRAITLLLIWAVQPVQSFSACIRVHFTHKRKWQSRRGGCVYNVWGFIVCLLYYSKMRDKNFMLYLFIYIVLNDSVSRPISGAQVCVAPATNICTALGFLIVIGVVVRQAFSLLHFFVLSHFQAGLRLSDTIVSSYRQMSNCTR